jgi:hypothetical protein
LPLIERVDKGEVNDPIDRPFKYNVALLIHFLLLCGGLNLRSRAASIRGRITVDAIPILLASTSFALADIEFAAKPGNQFIPVVKERT